MTAKLNGMLIAAGKTPLLMIHIGTSDMASGDTSQNIEDFGDLEKELKEKKVQMVFSEIFRREAQYSGSK